MIKKKRILIFLIYFIISLVLAILFYFAYKTYNTNKYIKYDEIISFSDNENQEIVFFNIPNDYVAICYYYLYPSENKVNQNTLIRKFNNSKTISYENFKIILEKISNKLDTDYKIYDTKVIKYGGENITVNSDNLKTIIDIINNYT